MYSLAGFDLPTHSSSPLGGRQRSYVPLDHTTRAYIQKRFYLSELEKKHVKIRGVR
jgi:hypothetical protein